MQYFAPACRCLVRTFRASLSAGMSLAVVAVAVRAQAPAGASVGKGTAGLEQRLDLILAQMTPQEKMEQLFYKTDGNARLGIPQFTGSDGPHGIGNKSVGWSSFPVTIAMAATWDTALIQRVGRAIALEQASRGRHRIAGPTLDLLSDPRNGRAPETIGEDPFLGGRITEAFLHGMNETAVFATIKHYNLNTYEAGRETNSYQIDQRSLVEFWGEHWRRAVQDGGALSVMCGYNLINGQKSAENYNLIKTVLRDYWGFRGYTMSDWGGFNNTAQAMAAELDFCEGNELYFKELPGLVASGKITTAQLDHAVKDVLRTKLLSGMIDGQPVVPADTRDSAVHRQLVYESGLRSIVLLKNQDAILPLTPKVKTVALIGPNAANLPLDGHSSSAVIPSYTITLQQALEKQLGAGHVRYVQGCEMNSANRDGFATAIEAARGADVVIFAGGLDNTVEGEEYFIKGDRLTGTVDLPGQQNALINELAAVNPNVVLVVISGGTCAVNKVLPNVKGLLYAFYPGQEGGRALADILLGHENPSGKLPATMPKDDGQLAPRVTDFRDVVTKGVGYRWFDTQKIQPEFAFGSGLSYTTFQYRNLRVTPESAAVGQEIVVTAEVTNTGDRAGMETAQLYVSAGRIAPEVAMPVKQLKGFAKIALTPGETKKVSFTLSSDELYVFDAASSRYFVPAGSYTIGVGGASDRLPLSAAFSLTSAAELPDLIVTNLRMLPAFPAPGEPVQFVASVLNRGTGPSPAAQPFRVVFRVGGQVVGETAGVGESIPAGGMALVCGSELPAGRTPYLVPAGKYSVEAEVDSTQAIAETNESNNKQTVTFVVQPR